MTRPTIGLSMYGRDDRGHFYLPSEYVDAVRRAGASAVLLPPGEQDLDAWLERVDGLIFCGGGDIDHGAYGGRPHSSFYMVDAERDKTEFALAQRVLERSIPTLAICRGVQVFNVVMGGTLHEHLPDVVGNTVAHRAPPKEPTLHTVILKADSKVAKILGTCECDTMSWHHQAINEVASPLTVVGHAPDGTIEAVEKNDHPWLVAVQWHPELTADEDARQQRLFDSLVTVAGDMSPSNKRS